jgi:hypothetical protein
MKKIIMTISLAVLPIMSGGSDYKVYAQGYEHSHKINQAKTSGLGLNHGQRWEMDEHTRTMLAQMEKTFFTANHSSQASLNAAGVRLKSQLDELITGCTMAGAAHEQLHIFMSEYISAIDFLAQAGDYTAARDAAIALKQHFATYKRYFR